MKMKTCPNCESKIGNSILGGKNELLNLESYNLLKSFLPVDFISENYCEKCIKDNNKDYELITKYNRYLKGWDENIHLKRIKNLNLKINKSGEELINEKKKIISKLSDSVMIFSNSPTKFVPIKFVESYIIVDTGMWSTSSDNYDSLISAVHDKMARDGKNSDDKLSEGFLKAKELIKTEVIKSYGNTLIDFKHTFSELANNGKILIYSQGTSALDNNKPILNFSEIEEKRKLTIESLEKEIFKIESFFKEKSIAELKKLMLTVYNTV